MKLKAFLRFSLPVCLLCVLIGLSDCLCDWLCVLIGLGDCLCDWPKQFLGLLSGNPQVLRNIQDQKKKGKELDITVPSR